MRGRFALRPGSVCARPHRRINSIAFYECGAKNANILPIIGWTQDAFPLRKNADM